MFVENRESLLALSQNQEEKQILELIINLIDDILEFAQPSNLLSSSVMFSKNIMQVKEKEFDLKSFRRYYLVAFGKASQTMAKWFVSNSNLYFTRIIIVSPDEYEPEFSSISNCEFFKAGHPLPNEESINAAEAVLSQFKELTSDDLCFILISGGGSALFEALDYDLSFSEYIEFTNELLSCGATIQEINTMRKHLSKVKGGKLAQQTKATLISFIISDVIGNNPSFIASGPTVPDETTWNDCKNILQKYNLKHKISEGIQLIVENGVKGTIDDTPSDNLLFSHVYNYVVGDNLQLLKHLEEILRKKYYAKILDYKLSGEAREVGVSLVNTANSYFGSKEKVCQSPFCFLLFAGETTVTLDTSPGIGGRNQELALSFALSAKENKSLYFASFGTDGVDGNSLAAGAIVGSFTFKENKSEEEGRSLLLSHNSNEFFRKFGGEIVTGPTGTNLMDINIICIITEK
ncbi:MAG: glycerate kinase type-2 family protein [Candidatus Heimdallarchaeaceae archaeon]|jgi:glycerate-2-kinase